jgi:hypothetical protein
MAHSEFKIKHLIETHNELEQIVEDWQSKMREIVDAASKKYPTIAPENKWSGRSGPYSELFEYGPVRLGEITPEYFDLVIEHDNNESPRYVWHSEYTYNTELLYMDDAELLSTINSKIDEYVTHIEQARQYEADRQKAAKEAKDKAEYERLRAKFEPK